MRCSTPKSSPSSRFQTDCERSEPNNEQRTKRASRNKSKVTGPNARREGVSRTRSAKVYIRLDYGLLVLQGYL
ncbi:hypothetical protein J6590_036344 [Homalodisca vitripennis]|nr:hypothetical protein J6590_036344 [Homalodisca vitripennis]